MRIDDVQKDTAIQPSISCSLISASLNDPPSYTALSYTWGKLADGLVTILINGRKFEAQTNLARALDSLYQDLNHGWLWVDAVCINQKDEQEKAWQLEQMVSVYETAALVLVWLGPAQNESDLAIEKLRELGQQVLARKEESLLYEVEDAELAEESVREHAAKTRMRHEEVEALMEKYYPGHSDLTFTGSAVTPPIEPIPDDHTTLADLLSGLEISDRSSSTVPWGPFKELLMRQWWQRVWVVQELTVARNVMFACGTKRILWPQLYAAFWAMYRFSGGIKAFMGGPSPLASQIHLKNELSESPLFKIDTELTASHFNLSAHFQLRHRAFWQKHPRNRLSLWELLVMASSPVLKQGIQATQKKDFIWALKGLSSDADGFRIDWPDLYIKTDEVAFTEVARALILSAGSLSLLSYNRSLNQQGSTEGGGEMQLPSWVPNWFIRPEYQIPNLAKSLNERLDDEFACSGALTLPEDTFSRADRRILTLRGWTIGEVDAIMKMAPEFPLKELKQPPLVFEAAIYWIREVYRFCNPGEDIQIDTNEIISTLLADQTISSDPRTTQWIRLTPEEKAGIAQHFDEIIRQEASFEQVAGDLMVEETYFADPKLVKKVKDEIIDELARANDIDSMLLRDPESRDRNPEDEDGHYTISDACVEIGVAVAMIGYEKGYDSQDEDYKSKISSIIGAGFFEDDFVNRLMVKKFISSQSPAIQALQEFNRFLIFAWIQMDHRRLFKVGENHIGLGPEHTQVGDEVVIAKGSAVPFVIRPPNLEGNGALDSKFIGECYVHGVMDGEWVGRLDKDRTADTFYIG